MSRFRYLFVFATAAGCLQAQTAVTELKLQVVPASKKIRPLETAAIQVQAIGTVPDSAGNSRSGRLQRDGWKASVREADGGWLSKAFVFQGKEPNPIEYVDRKTSGFAAILGQQLNQYTVKDTMLYTAPAKPGRYTVHVELEGKAADMAIEVAADAPSQKPPEQKSFSPRNRRAIRIVS